MQGAFAFVHEIISFDFLLILPVLQRSNQYAHIFNVIHRETFSSLMYQNNNINLIRCYIISGEVHGRYGRKKGK